MNVRHALRAVTTAGLVAALAVPAAANASTFRHTDPAKDVQRITSTNTVTNVPDNKTADVVHLQVAHTARHVRTTVRLRELGRRWLFVSRLQTARRGFQVIGRRTPGHRPTWTLARANGHPLTCDGLVGHQSPRASTITLTVPSSCIGVPRWVRVGAGFVVRTNNGAVFADDSQRTRHATARHLTMSPRIHRG
ncbi:MAG: hypothetical protein J2P22_02930 [Nocardioides sp.]|nr:hypothetical protein [Nocardioides sp.]